MIVPERSDIPSCECTEVAASADSEAIGDNKLQEVNARGMAAAMTLRATQSQSVLCPGNLPAYKKPTAFIIEVRQC